MELSLRTWVCLIAFLVTVALLVVVLVFWPGGDRLYLYNIESGQVLEVSRLDSQPPGVRLAFIPERHDQSKVSMDTRSLEILRTPEGALHLESHSVIVIDSHIHESEESALLYRHNGFWHRFLVGERRVDSGAWVESIRSGEALPEGTRRMAVVEIPHPDFARALHGDDEAASRFAERYTGHPIAALLEIEQAFYHEDPDIAAAALEEHRTLLEGTGGFPAATVSLYERLLEVRRRAADQGTVARLMHDHAIETDAGAVWSQEDIDAVRAAVEPGMLFDVPPGGLLGPSPTEDFTSFLGLQTQAKVRRVHADFLLLRGRTREAEQLLTEETRVAYALMEFPAVIGRMIGYALLMITNGGMEHVLLSGPLEPEELESTWHRYDALWREGAHFDSGEDEALWPHLGEATNEEVHTRRAVSRAHMGLLREATAARVHLLRTGELPSSPEETGLLDESNRSPDLFDSDGVAVKWRKVSDDELLIYSIGPNRSDGDGAYVYQPSLGTFSHGDIVVRVERERPYAFPLPEELPRTRDELFERFPRGLPPDPFASTRDVGYAVLDEEPPQVFSFGPGVQQHLYAPQRQSEPEPGLPAVRMRADWIVYGENPPPEPYDPTHGTISTGVIFGLID